MWMLILGISLIIAVTGGVYIWHIATHEGNSEEE